MYYIGDGKQYVPGVPLRDMTMTEWSSYPEESRQALLAAKVFSGKAPARKEEVTEAPPPDAQPIEKAEKAEGEATE